MLHDAEYRRCLLEVDVQGLIALHRVTNPGVTVPSPAEALVALHMARCDAKYIPLRAKTYSRAFLAERGIRQIDGVWTPNVPPEGVPFETVGIASTTPTGKIYPIHRKIVRGMTDAYLNAVAKGVHEAPMQKEAMLKERARIRFKARMA